MPLNHHPVCVSDKHMLLTFNYEIRHFYLFEKIYFCRLSTAAFLKLQCQIIRTYHGATWPPHCRGFKITLRQTTRDRTPPDEWPAQRINHYLTTHNTNTRRTSMLPIGFFKLFINNSQFPTKESYIVAKSPPSAFPPWCPFEAFFTGAHTLKTITHLSGPLRYLSLATQTLAQYVLRSQTHNRSRRAAADLRFRPRVLWDRLSNNYLTKKYAWKI
jgi:hypothetical protein